MTTWTTCNVRTLVLLAFLMAGCAGDGVVEDGGVVEDAAATDASGSDRTLADTGAPEDGSSPDAVMGDVSRSDGGTPTLLFHSDWSAARGSDDDALTDGAIWQDTYCESRAETLQVIAADTVDFPRTENVLRLQQLGPEVCGVVGVRQVLPESTTHWGRFYFRSDETMTTHNHPVVYNVTEGIQIVPWMRSGFSDEGTSGPSTGDFIGVWTGPEYPYNQFFAGTSGKPSGQLSRDRLPHGEWFRYEWMIEYVTSNTILLYPRIYNLDGDMLYSAANYFHNDHFGTGPHSLESWYAEGNTMSVEDAGLARDFGIGNEGPATSPVSGEYFYIADVALSAEGWIGE